jgi:ArsR family transcriptional regulator
MVLSMGRAKLQIFEQFAELARVLGHAHRLELIECIAQGERSVERLAEISGLSIANTSQHLKQLRLGGFVRARRDGKRVLYGLADGPILSLIAALRIYAERNRAEVGKIVSDYFNRLDDLEPVSRRELARRVKAGTVVVLDVRPEDEFGLGHVSGALNIPVGELRRRLAELPKGQEIVAYCRGAYCVFSFEAVAFLRKRGFTARRLEDGFPEWRSSGLPVSADSR